VLVASNRGPLIRLETACPKFYACDPSLQEMSKHNHTVSNQTQVDAL